MLFLSFQGSPKQTSASAISQSTRDALMVSSTPCKNDKCDKKKNISISPLYRTEMTPFNFTSSPATDVNKSDASFDGKNSFKQSLTSKSDEKLLVKFLYFFAQHRKILRYILCYAPNTIIKLLVATPLHMLWIFFGSVRHPIIN